MKANIILGALVVALLFGAVFLLGYSGRGSTAASVQNAGQSNGRSGLVAPQPFYNFGTISMKNGDVSYDFTVTNPTDKDITVPTLVTSCMCTRALIIEPDGTTKGPFKMPGMGYVPPADEIIKAGESRTIRVIYDPNAHGPAGVGPIDRFAILTDADGGTVQLEIKAVVTP